MPVMRETVEGRPTSVLLSFSLGKLTKLNEFTFRILSVGDDVLALADYLLEYKSANHLLRFIHEPVFVRHIYLKQREVVDSRHNLAGV